jgi:hypothetical protein
MIIGNNIQQPRNNSYCKLNLRGEATADSSPSGHSIVNNGVSVDNSKYKYGDGSLAFQSANSDELHLADSDDWDINEYWTISFWIWKVLPESNQEFIYSRSETTGDKRSIIIRLNDGDIDLIIYENGDGSSYQTLSISQSTLNSESWNHIAIVSNNGVVSVYFNGVQTGGTMNRVPYNTNIPLYIGSNRGEQNYLNGNIDSLTLHKGIALYTRDFTPPNRAA